MEYINNQTQLGESWMPLVLEFLERGRKVQHLKFRGVSMLPMLRQGKDSVELSPLPKELKKFDLPVYRRADGQYVMHRIVEVKDGHYICLGDNTVSYETIWPDQMIGVVSAFYRGDRRVEVDDFGYQLYCRLWRLTRPWRKLLLKIKRWVKN